MSTEPVSHPITSGGNTACRRLAGQYAEGAPRLGLAMIVHSHHRCCLTGSRMTGLSDLCVFTDGVVRVEVVLIKAECCELSVCLSCSSNVPCGRTSESPSFYGLLCMWLNIFL